MASVGCVMKRPLASFTLREVLCQMSWSLGSVSAGWRPDVGRSVVAGPLREPVRVSANACFLSGFPEDVGNWAIALCLRFRSPAQGERAAWSQKRSKTWSQGALCVLIENPDAEAVLQGGTCEIGVPAKGR